MPCLVVADCVGVLLRTERCKDEEIACFFVYFLLWCSPTDLVSCGLQVFDRMMYPFLFVLAVFAQDVLALQPL